AAGLMTLGRNGSDSPETEVGSAPDPVSWTTNSEEPALDIAESIGRILRREEVVADLFYDVFLDRYPEVRAFFVEVNLWRQAVLLTMALKAVVEHYTYRFPLTKMYLQILGHRHHTWGVKRELYPKFRDCLLTTLERFHGTEWDHNVARQWREALDGAIAVMLEAYPQCSSV
ncbi:MAG: hypothetical protein HY000_26450, partial [Planctomycetes bacterium]|nr:hypothetical protein [Planctomycetota bacterium]